MVILILFGSITTSINYSINTLIGNINFQNIILQASAVSSLLVLIKLKLFKIPKLEIIGPLIILSLFLYFILTNTINHSPDLNTHIEYIRQIKKIFDNQLTDFNSLNFYPNAIHISLGLVSLILKLDTFNLICFSLSLLIANIVTTFIQEKKETNINKFVLALAFSAALPAMIDLLNRGFFTFIVGVLFTLRISMYKLKIGYFFPLSILIIFIHPSGLFLLFIKFVNEFKLLELRIRINILNVFRGIFLILLFCIAFYKILYPAFIANVSTLDIRNRSIDVDLQSVNNLTKGVYLMVGLNYSICLILIYTVILFLLWKSYIRKLVIITYVLSASYIVLPYFLSINEILNSLIVVLLAFTNSEPDRGLFMQLIVILQTLYLNRSLTSLKIVRSKFKIS